VSATSIEAWKENLQEERDGIALYEGLADTERDPKRARVFRQLADAERRHSAVWERKLTAAGEDLPAAGASARVRSLIWLARRFGTTFVLPMVIRAESADAARYALQSAEAEAMVKEEEAHRLALEQLNGKTPSSAVDRIATRERWHRGGKAGSLRAAVFGVNDGLCSNVALVLGVAAGGAQGKALLLTGLAGLFAGSFSMAVGEFVSVASQRDLLRLQIIQEERELRETPEEERDEMVELFRQKGLDQEQARRAADDLMSNPRAALDTLVREELGLDPEDLGSPVGAALASFFSFAVGAIIPVLPFLWASTRIGVIISAAAAFATLATVGGLLGFLSGSGALRSAARMVGLATLATGVTVLIGRLVGSSL
jgi:VIT1/CCC1 family predicted Fe2+/Mn2+ transporter